MRSLRTFWIILSCFAAACGGCDDAQDPVLRLDTGGEDSGFRDAGDLGSASSDMDGADDAATDSDAAISGRDSGTTDAGDDDAAGDDAGSGGAATCGDGQVEGAEACDDANQTDGDYCSADCGQVTGSCGDAATQTNEACDDGNQADNDYCSADCSQVTGACGDGVIQGNETCDDAVTLDCGSTHDGGNGACVPAGTCSPGYVLSQGSCVANPTGLSVPCSNGPGWTLFRYHYSSNSTSAQIDVWDATCSYSFAPNSACNVRQICPGFCDVPTTSAGYPIFDTSDYMRVRFNVNGLNFTQATLWVQARSYATSSSTRFRVWSPLYGEVVSDLVDNDFTYDWYSVDWTGYLYPSDDPNLTAIQLYGANGNVAVSAVEMCVE